MEQSNAQTTFCLAKTVLIFYTFLTLIIAPASFYNLVDGLMMGHASFVRIGPFSLFGFILLPFLLFTTYRNKKCVIEYDKVSIGKWV